MALFCAKFAYILAIRNLVFRWESCKGNVWYWEGVYHLLRDNNYCTQFWFCLVSLFYCLIAHPLYNFCVCVFLTKKKGKKRKTLNVVKSSHIGKVWYGEGVYHLLVTLTTTFSFGVGTWVYSLISSPFPDKMCVCVTDKWKTNT